MGAGGPPSRISGLPAGLPPSSEFSSLPCVSDTSAVSRLTLEPEAGTIEPTAPPAPYRCGAKTGTTRTATRSRAAFAGSASASARPMATIRIKPFALKEGRFSMKRKTFGRDRGLSLRMLFTGFLLGLLYVIFAVVLFQVLNVGLIPMLVIVIGLAFFQYYTSDKLALRAAGARIVERDDAPELDDVVERVCRMAALPKPKVAVVDTDVPNAFATGRSPKHAAVAVTTGLWRRLDKEEIEGVLAHELSHVANRDVLVMTVASFFAMLAALLTRFGLHAGMFGGFGGGEPQQQQQLHTRLADCPGGVGSRVRDQLRPDPNNLPLPGVRGRPRLGADHRRAGVSDECAPKDLESDRRDPRPRPARSRRNER